MRQRAMKGMSKIMRQSGKMVVLENYAYGLQKAGSNAEEYLQFLKSRGFRIKFFEGEIDYNEKAKDKTFYTDFIAIKIDYMKIFKSAIQKIKT